MNQRKRRVQDSNKNQRASIPKSVIMIPHIIMGTSLLMEGEELEVDTLTKMEESK